MHTYTYTCTRTFAHIYINTYIHTYRIRLDDTKTALYCFLINSKAKKLKYTKKGNRQ